MKIRVNSLCPCGSKQKYKKCCKIFHNGALPNNALLLMKSRFSAFVAGEVTYIIKTTHPDNQDFTNNLSSWGDSIIEFSSMTNFQKLEIVEFIDGENEAYVTFKATLFQNNMDVSFTEKSKFLKEDGKWLYESGEFI